MDTSRAQLVMDNVKGWNYCDVCESTINPNWKCIVCDDVLCEKCKVNHTTARKTNTHKIISYQDHNKEVYSSSNLYCKIHQENRIILCCQECDIPVCDDCLDTHSSHKLVKIKDFAREKREALVTEARSKVKSVEQSHFAKCMDYLTKLEEKADDDALQNSESCDKLIDTCISTLKDVANSLKSEIKTGQERAHDVIQTRRKIVTDQMKLLKTDLTTYERKLSESDHYVVQHANENKTKMKVTIPTAFETRTQNIDVSQENIDVKIMDSFLQKCNQLSWGNINTRRRNLFVAVIYLGTYISDCVCSTVNKNSRSIFSLRAHGLGLKSYYPTSILLNQNGEFDSYGEEATKHYSELISDDEQTGWYFFKHFPKELCGVEVPLTISSTDGRTFEYLKVYTSAIRYFKQRVFDSLQSTSCGFAVELAEWVITVPSTANETANIFIQNAAKLAGIHNKIVVIDEAEAASYYCREEPVVNLGGNELSFMAFMPGSKQFIMHIDSEMVNMTVLEVMRNGQHKKIFSEDLPDSSLSSGACQKFENCLREVFGEKQASLIQTNYKGEYNEMMEAFKDKICKVGFYHDHDRWIKIEVNPDLYKKFLELQGNQEGISSEQIKLGVAGCRLLLKQFTFETIFDDWITHTIQKVKSIEEKIKFKFLIMVGEMAESEILQRKLRCAVPSLTVLVPPEPKIAILKGAILCTQKSEV